MSAIRIFTGLLLLAAVVGPLAIAAWRWQRSLAPRAAPLHLLAACVIALVLVLVAAELVGTVGLFSIGWLIGASWLVAGLAYLAAERIAPRAAPGPPSPAAPSSLPGWITIAVGGAAAAVAVRWLAATAAVLANGLHDTDTRNHHLTFAVEFVRTGEVTGLHHVYPDPFLVAQPQNTELLQAIGMLAMDTDVLAPLHNLGWLALFLLAAWCVGIRDRAQPLTLLAAVWLAAIPVMIQTNAATAVNDIAVLAGLTSAVAFWRTSDYDRGWLAVAGLALGLAVGVKVTALAPAVALFVAMVAIAPRERRRATLGVLAVAVLAAGAFWYVRLIARTGSPMPAIDVPLLPAFDTPILDRLGFNVAHYLTNGDVLRDILWPGLRFFFGVGGVLAALALLLALRPLVRARESVVLALAACALVSLVAYLLTPAGAFGPEGRPAEGLFLANLRYALPALTLLGLTAALATASAGPRLRAGFAALLTAATAAGVLRFGIVDDFPDYMQSRYTLRAVALLGLLVVGAALARRLWPRPALAWVAAAAAVGLAAVTVGPTVTRSYLNGATEAPVEPALAPVYEWASQLDGAHIGHYAVIQFYPLYGRDWQNRLDYIGIHGDHGDFRAVASCREYIEVLDERRFDFVVLAPSRVVAQDLSLARWTATQPATSVVLDADPYAAFKVAPPYDPGRCPAAATARQEPG